MAPVKSVSIAAQHPVAAKPFPLPALMSHKGRSAILPHRIPFSSMKKDSWLYSDSFLKRAFAIWGHNVVAGCIIAVMFFGALILVSLAMVPFRMIAPV